MADSTLEPQLKQKFDELYQIELQISKVIGPGVFDYGYILDKTYTSEINITALDDSGQQLLKNYIAKAQEILALAEIDFQAANDSLINTFISISHEIYLLRFIQSRMFFAEYSLVRIPTYSEQAIVSEFTEGRYQQPELGVAIDIPGVFVVNENGSLNITDTINKENSNHTICATMSGFGETLAIKEQFYNDYCSITIKGFLPRLNQEQVLELIEICCERISIFMASRVYSYINRGFNLKSAKENVLSYYQNTTQKLGIEFPQDMQPVTNYLEKIILDTFSKLPSVKKPVAELVTNEFKELLVYYINQGLLIPENYYSCNFRIPDQKHEIEKNFHLILDLFLIQEDGQAMARPIESYDVDFSQRAKTFIFQGVTNNIVSPYYTLNDYLESL